MPVISMMTNTREALSVTIDAKDTCLDVRRRLEAERGWTVASTKLLWLGKAPYHNTTAVPIEKIVVYRFSLTR